MHGRAACVAGGVHAEGHAWQGGMHSRGVCMAGRTCMVGACVAGPLQLTVRILLEGNLVFHVFESRNTQN